MSSDDEDAEEGSYKLEAELGSLRVTAEGTDPEFVDEKFDEKLERLLRESEDVSKALRDGTRCVQ